MRYLKLLIYITRLQFLLVKWGGCCLCNLHFFPIYQCDHSLKTGLSTVVHLSSFCSGLYFIPSLSRDCNLLAGKCRLIKSSLAPKGFPVRSRSPSTIFINQLIRSRLLYFPIGVFRQVLFNSKVPK